VSDSPPYEQRLAPQIKDQGVRFECQGSGKCCVSRGEYGFVYLTLDDRRKLAKHLALTTSVFTKKYCEKTRDCYHLKQTPKEEDCIFLKNQGCSVYEARPVQCRTWPFWPEVMDAKSWSNDVQRFCPGIGKGRWHSPREIKETLAWQIRSNKKL